MAAPMLTWQDLLTYKFPTPPPLAIRRATSTASYTATTLPPRRIQPRLSIPDQSLLINQRIVPRALAALQRGFASLTELPPIPANLQSVLQMASDWLSIDHPDSKAQIMPHVALLIHAASLLIKAIFVAVDGRIPSIVRATPPRRHSRQGDCNVMITSQAQHLSSTLSFELKKTEVAFAHGGRNGLQETISLNPALETHGAAAIALKLSLQMAHATPPSRFGLVYTGHTFMVTELGHLPNHGGLWILMSPLYSVFNDQLYNVPDAYHAKFPNGLSSAPILACLVAFGCCTLPGFEIDPIQPPVVLGNLSASPDNGEQDSDGDHGSDDDDGPDNDGTSGESQGSGSTAILGLKGSKEASFSPNSYLFGPPLQGLVLHVTADSALLIAYDHPELSSMPRLALPVAFVFEDSHTPQPLLHSHNHLSLQMQSVTPSKLHGVPTSGDLTQLSSKIRTFLECWSGDTPSVPLFSIHPQQFLVPLPIRLFECIGSGRTSEVWHAEVKGADSLVTVTVKMISGRYAASVIRESLFYQAVFPLVGLDKFVPRYYGTYASCGGGWYAIVLEDVGVPVGMDDLFPQDNLPLKKEVQRIRQAFEKAGICHGDIRPPNVLQAPDGTFRLVDFGISTLMSKGIRSQQYK